MNESSQYPLEKLSHIDAEKIKQIHVVCIKYGKTQNAGIRDEGSLVHIAEKIRKMAKKHSDMTAIAAIAIEKITKNHPFWDGNHRTAYEVARFILILFGYRLNVTVTDAVDFMRKIDEKNISTRGIEDWVRDRLVPMKER